MDFVEFKSIGCDFRSFAASEGFLAHRSAGGIARDSCGIVRDPGGIARDSTRSPNPNPKHDP